MKNVKIGKWKSWAELFRIEHGIMLSFALLASLWYMDAQLNFIQWIAAFLTPLFIEMGAFALNDYYDVETDKKNKRFDRPIIRGEIKREAAFKIGLACLIIGVIASFPLGKVALGLALFSATLSYYYDARLKYTPLLGNAAIAFSMALPFLYAFAITGKSHILLVDLAVTAFIMGLAREIGKDLQDLKGDAEVGMGKTLPMLIGEKYTQWLVVFIFLISAVPIGHIAINLSSKAGWFFLLLAIWALVKSIAFFTVWKQYNLFRKFTLIGMALGMLAVFVGKII